MSQCLNDEIQITEIKKYKSQNYRNANEKVPKYKLQKYRNTMSPCRYHESMSQCLNDESRNSNQRNKQTTEIQISEIHK